MNKIEKIFNPYFFLSLNIVIILLAEFVGGSKWFLKSGAIHFIAVGFVVLAVIRIFYHPDTYDPILQNFVRAGLAAMFVFAIAHVIEFISFMLLNNYVDAVYANTANLYLVSMLLIILGEGLFLWRLNRRGLWKVPAVITLIVMLLVFTVYLLFNNKAISLEPDEAAPFIYVAIAIAATVIGLVQARAISRHVGFMKDFVKYLSASVVVIGISILPNIFYDPLTDFFHGAEFQAIYLSHFAFYAALSLLFLSFSKLNHLGGLMGEVKAQEK